MENFTNEGDETFATNITLAIKIDCFLDEFKFAKVSQIFKKIQITWTRRITGLSLFLSHVSKSFERMVYHQSNNLMTYKLPENYELLRKIILYNTACFSF